MNITIEPGAAALLDALHRAGFAAYAVGGCVRDSLLGLAPHDWDLCTAARPEQVMELFGEKQCIPTGLQHGTVTVKRDGRLYEITTFRTEGSYSDGRHPDSVAFVPDVREDLARRDFTINAMAYSAEEGLCDPFGGQEDLARGVVRAVGEPLRRFEEDALRILRLYRFAARFGFVIDEATEAAAKQLAAHLDCVSVERIEEELNKLLSAPKPGAYLEPEVLAFVLPELPPDYLSEAREIIDALPAGAEEVTTRWAALLLPLGEDGTRKALKRLKCSNAVIDGVATLVKEGGAGVRGAFSSDTETGCGSQRLRRPSRGSCTPLAAAPTATPCFRRWRRSLPLQGIPSPALLPSATGSHPPDGPQRNSPPSRQVLNLQTKRLLGRLELPMLVRLTRLCAALYPEQKEEWKALQTEAETLTAQNACCRVSQLAVNGRDLMAAGVAPGPGLRRVLEALLEEVITGRLPNEKAELLAFAAKFSAS